MAKTTTAESFWCSYLTTREAHPRDWGVSLDMYFAAVELELIKRQKIYPIEYGPEIEKHQYINLIGYEERGSHGPQNRRRSPSD